MEPYLDDNYGEAKWNIYHAEHYPYPVMSKHKYPKYWGVLEGMSYKGLIHNPSYSYNVVIPCSILSSETPDLIRIINTQTTLLLYLTASLFIMHSSYPLMSNAYQITRITEKVKLFGL